MSPEQEEFKKRCVAMIEEKMAHYQSILKDYTNPAAVIAGRYRISECAEIALTIREMKWLSPTNSRSKASKSCKSSGVEDF